jgi:hypothetical protein
MTMSRSSSGVGSKRCSISGRTGGEIDLLRTSDGVISENLDMRRRRDEKRGGGKRQDQRESCCSKYLLSHSLAYQVVGQAWVARDSR